MRVGAVITAAGMSSRMGDFKPLLNIGSMSIVKRIVATLRQAGAENIVLVTGYNAEALERHLAGSGIVFLRNEDYEHSHMFDSAKIGLAYLVDKCDRILFTPVDIPLYTASTVSILLNSGAELACPTYNGQSGHPLLLSDYVARKILTDSGEGGMQGAITRCGVDMLEISVDDEGILHDADTPQDYKKLLEFHNKQLARPIVSISIARENHFFDNKTAMLLSLIDETGSMIAACGRMQLSYSAGWNTVRNLENQMQKSIVSRTQGGSGGGNSRLTEDGRELLRRFTQYESWLREEATQQFQIFFEDFF
ncbi:MAG: NTP transferase domain-containing protein [Eubacteriales bacterium]|nr:NTP transferase domain-containing protein [Eubacteriales bacterium]